MLFVHGGAEDSRAWTPQLEALSDEFTVIAWDEPGAGGSADVPDGFGLADCADCLAGMTRAGFAAPTTGPAARGVRSDRARTLRR